MKRDFIEDVYLFCEKRLVVFMPENRFANVPADVLGFENFAATALNNETIYLSSYFSVFSLSCLSFSLANNPGTTKLGLD